MAVAAQQQTQIIHGDNGVNVGRVVDTVVDERTIYCALTHSHTHTTTVRTCTKYSYIVLSVNIERIPSQFKI